MYAFNLEPEANRLAATKARSAEAFATHWEKVLADRNILAKSIWAGDLAAGTISCFRRDGLPYVGYWLGKAFWGQGIASRALALLLEEVAIRPLYARAATSNGASLRVLEKCGFVVRRVQFSPADERNLECEEALLVLE
jgi:RimJ/RimL family protein N-acetyltransferase